MHTQLELAYKMCTKWATTQPSDTWQIRWHESTKRRYNVAFEGKKAIQGLKWTPAIQFTYFRKLALLLSFYEQTINFVVFRTLSDERQEKKTTSTTAKVTAILKWHRQIGRKCKLRAACLRACSTSSVWESTTKKSGNCSQKCMLIYFNYCLPETCSTDQMLQFSLP